MLQTLSCRQAVRKRLVTLFLDSNVRPSARLCSPIQQKRHSSHIVKDGRPFRMAIIGSGPAGFYTAYKVMSSIQDAVIDMYEYLPVPFGLVRFGVAPDHPEVKNCQDKFSEVASSPNFNFIGNVDIGGDLPIGTLKDHYDAILFTYGASQDRKLGIKGEDECEGIYSARDFVGWYNGLPKHSNLEPKLDCNTAVIIGQGNVALDVARTLLTDIDVLRKTDMTEQALATLSQHKIKHVHVIGRRGPMQASFTIKEVRELMNLPGVAFDPIEQSLLPPPTKKLPRTPKRMLSLLREGSSTQKDAANKSWSLDFLQSPHEFVGHGLPKQLGAVNFLRNRYQYPNEQSEPKAKVMQIINTPPNSIHASIAFRSIGYKSVPLPGLKDLGIPFDEVRGVISNDYYGRITAVSPLGNFADKDTKDNDILPGLYCAGWVKRGPAGVIANTMEDAFATAEAIASDWEAKKSFLPGGEGWDALRRSPALCKCKAVSWEDWLQIDAAEKARGKAKGKVREKFTSVKEMLSVLE